MVSPVMSSFEWGADGKARTPAQVKKQRDIAAALMSAAPQGKGWAGALSQATAGLSSGILNNQADVYETRGTEAAGNLFAGLGQGASTDSIAAALADPAAAWATPGQAGVAEALLNNNLRQQDPAYQLDLDYKRAQLAQLQSGEGGSGESFFGNIVPMQDANGNVVLGQASNQGNWQPLQGAEGFTPAPTTKQIDTGTEIITQDIYGNELFRTPKQNEQAAYDTAFGGAAGKVAAEKINSLPQVIAQSDNMVSTIDGVLNDPALDYSTGWLSWMQQAPGTDQYRFGQRALQLQGQAFLQAFESIKGAGQITETEGAKATQAIGRLSTAQAPDDYRAALLELKGIVQAAKQRALAGAPASAGVQPTPGAATPSPQVRVFNPATGRLE